MLAAGDIEVVGRAGDADTLLHQVNELRPDVAIVDIRMPPTHTDEGLVAAARIREAHPDIGVLVLSQYLEPSYALRLIDEHPEQVGYLLKERIFTASTLLDAVHRACTKAKASSTRPSSLLCSDAVGATTPFGSSAPASVTSSP